MSAPLNKLMPAYADTEHFGKISTDAASAQRKTFYMSGRTSLLESDGVWSRCSGSHQYPLRAMRLPQSLQLSMSLCMQATCLEKFLFSHVFGQLCSKGLYAHVSAGLFLAAHIRSRVPSATHQHDRQTWRLRLSYHLSQKRVTKPHRAVGRAAVCAGQ